MSGKSLVFIALVGVAAYSLTRAAPPLPAGATPADSAAVATAGVGARFEYGIGALGSKIIGGMVRGMVAQTEQSLVDMHDELKTEKGPSADRARNYSKKVMHSDSVALSDLTLGHPLSAMNSAMDGKSVLSAVRDNLGPR